MVLPVVVVSDTVWNVPIVPVLPCIHRSCSIAACSSAANAAAISASREVSTITDIVFVVLGVFVLISVLLFSSSSSDIVSVIRVNTSSLLLVVAVVFSIMVVPLGRGGSATIVGDGESRVGGVDGGGADGSVVEVVMVVVVIATFDDMLLLSPRVVIFIRFIER